MNKLPLRAPLERLFDQRLPTQTMDRLWLRIRQVEIARPRRRALLLAWAGAACVFWATGVYFWSRPSALRLSNRNPLPALFSARQPSTVSFADGSQVELGPEARLDVLQNNEHLFVVALRTGRARFSVVPGGPRAWRVECGPLSVDVVGTIFSVERGSAAVKVQVERGRVLVSGAGVPDRVAPVSASESIVVPIATLAPTLSSASTAGTAASPAALGQPLAPLAASDAIGAARTSAVGHRLDPQQPAETRGPSSNDPSPSPSRPPASDAVDDLLQQADAARRAGTPARAVSLLQRILAEHPKDVRATLAQFTLGKLYLDSLGEPGRAAVYFTRAIEGGIPGALAEDAHARLVQAFVRAGNPAAAASAAARYRARYPTGRHLQDVNRWAVDASGP